MTKIISLVKLLFYIDNFKKLGRKIVFVTGCFDLLHSAHKLFLQKAKAKGDILAVGLEVDQRVKTMKGTDRPINLWPVRAANLARLKAVDFVFSLPSDINRPQAQSKLLAKLKPDVLAVSSHTYHLEKKRALVEKFGGRLKNVMEYDLQFSTSKLLSVRRKANKG